MESKKAQGLSVTTIILIILGVVVLVVLIIGFTQGWGSVKEFFTGGQSELSQISTQCSVACATGDKVSWCQQRTAEVDGEDVKGTCTHFASLDKGVDECSDPKVSTCDIDKPAIGTVNCEGYNYIEGDNTKIAKLCPKITSGSCKGKPVNSPLSKDGTAWRDVLGDFVCCDVEGCA